MKVIDGGGLFTMPEGEPNHYLEHLSVADLSVGTYSIPAGGVDTQDPHTQDEVYVVTAGRAKFETAGGTIDTVPGTVLFVPAGQKHRFIDIAEDFAVLVIFAPPY